MAVDDQQESRTENITDNLCPSYTNITKPACNIYYFVREICLSKPCINEVISLDLQGVFWNKSMWKIELGNPAHHPKRARFLSIIFFHTTIFNNGVMVFSKLPLRRFFQNVTFLFLPIFCHRFLCAIELKQFSVFMVLFYMYCNMTHSPLWKTSFP